MRNIKPAPKPVRLAYNGATKNSASKPLTLWFANSKFAHSGPGLPRPFQIRVLTTTYAEDYIVVEESRDGGTIELIRVPISFIGLFQVSR